MQKLLKDFSVGEKGSVVKIDAEGKIRRRLFDMGVTPNTVIELRKLAPLGDPMEVNLRGFELALRKEEAGKVLMEVAG